MLNFSNKRIAIFASTVSLVFALFLLSFLKARDNGIMGYVVIESSADKISLIGLFIAIAVIIGIMTFVTILYKQSNQY